MNLEVSESFVTASEPFLVLHTGIGLFIVAVFMYLRSDSVLKLFGVGIALMASPAVMTVLDAWLELPGAVQSAFTALSAFVNVVGVIIFVIVGSSDYAPRWRRVAIGGIIVWAVVLTVMGPLLGFSDAAADSDAFGVALTLTMVWFMVGWFIAFLEAAHIAVEHSHGEPYRSILMAAMSVYAVGIVVGVAGGPNDQLIFFNGVLTTAMVFVMWVAVVLHERKEIAAEHRSDAAQPT